MMGQTLLDPPTVKGYEGGEAWLNPASWLARRTFMLAAGDQATGRGILSRIAPGGDLRERATAVHRHILGCTPAPDLVSRVVQAATHEGSSGAERLIPILLTHPDFQRC